MLEEKKKKNYMFFIFSTYLHVVLLKFQVRSLVGWGIQLCIQRVLTWHTFGGPISTKKDKYMKNVMLMFLMYFLFFAEKGPPKVFQVCIHWMWN